MSITSTTTIEKRTSARVYGVQVGNEVRPVRFTATHTLEIRGGIIDIESVVLVADMSEVGFMAGMAPPAILRLSRNGKEETLGGCSFNYTGEGCDRELFSVSWSTNIQDVFYTVELLND